MKKRGRGHGEHGVVSSVHETSDRKHVRVTVRHGRRKPLPKAKKGEAASLPFNDYERETTMAVPAHKAKHYPVGKKVRMAMHPHDDDTDEDYDIMGGKSF